MLRFILTGKRRKGFRLAPPKRRVGRLRIQAIFLNLPLLVGALIVLALFLIVLFGPVWAPENPYLSGMKS
ncbi:MAG TPA: hypothetical protein ENG33_04680, partial [Chloroflexi bacterium]|nr:hypothetical protein [Chloroflexota bacterium]